MKARWFGAAAAALLAALTTGWTQGAPMPRARVGDFYIGAGIMETWGDGGFTISGLDSSVGRFTSVLEFPMDGRYFVLEAGIEEFYGGFGVHLRYGSSVSLEGTAVDTDFAWDIRSGEYIKSLGGSDGESVFLNLDVSYRIFGAGAREGGGTRVDVFGGYAMQDATFNVTDVHMVVQDGRATDRRFAGVAATYDMEFYGLRAGVRGEVAVGASSVLSGSVAVLPYVKADGFGQWIARGKMFDHDATGWGVDFFGCYEYVVSSSVRLWVGMGYTRMEGTDGIDRQFFFTGEPIGNAHLDELESSYRFVMIGGEFRF